jgi:hypothetical protein
VSLKILALRAATRAIGGLAAWLGEHPVIVRSTEFALIAAAIVFINLCVAG